MRHFLFPTIICAVFGTSQALELTGEVCDPDQEPVAGLPVHFLTTTQQTFSGETDKNGKFRITLPDEQTIAGSLEVDAIEVISSGYARPKTIPWDSGQPPEIPTIELKEIAPTLDFEKRPDGTNCLRFTFDWVPGAVPITLRSYCVERSTDLSTWTTVMNVGMACPPVEFIDETAIDEKNCYYRIREIDSIWMPGIGIEDIGLIGDPTMVPWDLASFAPDWPDNIVLLNLDELPNPGVPIIAPEIRLVEEEEPAE